jgi:flagellar motor switch protein FliN/FliY
MIMTNHGKEDPACTFAQLWAEVLARVLGQIAATPFPIEAADTAPDAVPPPAATDLNVTITSGGSVRGEMSLRIPQASALALVRVFNGDSDTNSRELTPRELTANDRSALQELFRQIAGRVSTAARPRWPELPLTASLSEAPTWSPAASGWIVSSSAAPRPLGMEWKLSAALLSALLAAWQEEPAAGASENLSGADNLGFFMDVELDVTLRFGGKNILLKEILDLGPGSVLELDREIQDPADLLLDGKLIARGEVVMVNGNYGLRVTEVFTGSQSAA